MSSEQQHGSHISPLSIHKDDIIREDQDDGAIDGEKMVGYMNNVPYISCLFAWLSLYTLYWRLKKSSKARRRFLGQPQTCQLARLREHGEQSRVSEINAY